MITLKSLVLRRGTKTVLDGATLTIHAGEKIGLVGRNGAGKSSLFALFSGNLHEDAGDFFIPPAARIAEVSQEMPETSQSATEFVVEGDQWLMAAAAEVDAAEASGDGERMAHAYMALHDAGSHDANARAQALILGLGFSTDSLMSPVKNFSGGWRMRLQLARALMCPSDILLLDEPTNHLDLDALVWLEDWLKRYDGTMIVISHDREFLDAITETTLSIDNAQITRYSGNYSAFEEAWAVQLEQEQNAYVKQQEKIAHLTQFITRFKAKASKAKQAQSRVKALDRMEKLAPILTTADFCFEFSEPDNLPNPMLVMEGVDLGYPPPESAGADEKPVVVVHNVTRTVMPGQRVGILGANGQGKSTLVKTIAQTLAPQGGVLTEGKGLRIGYFAQQELEVLDPKSNPLEHFVRLARSMPQGNRHREQELRTFLGTFNFSGDTVKQLVGTMSGGEKARLVLAMIVWQKPNLLLLDEPTNHLDLATREALAVALNEFEGTVMLVSHDRSLLRSVCDEFWRVSDGVLSSFDGDLEDYQRLLLSDAKRLKEATKLQQKETKSASEAALPRATNDGKKRDKQLKTQQRDTARLEEKIRDLEKQKQALEIELKNLAHHEKIALVAENLQKISTALNDAEEKWLLLLEGTSIN